MWKKKKAPEITDKRALEDFLGLAGSAGSYVANTATYVNGTDVEKLWEQDPRTAVKQEIINAMQQQKQKLANQYQDQLQQLANPIYQWGSPLPPPPPQIATPDPNKWLQYDPNSVAVTSWDDAVSTVSTVNAKDEQSRKIGLLNLILNVGVDSAIRICKKFKIAVDVALMKQMDEELHRKEPEPTQEDLNKVIAEVAKEVKI